MNTKLQRPNYSQFPNSISDNIENFSGAEAKILIVICRHTIGWHKDLVIASIPQLTKWTGISYSGVQLAIKTLMEKGLLVREPTGNSFAYSLQIIDEEPREILAPGKNYPPQKVIGEPIRNYRGKSATIYMEIKERNIKGKNGEGELFPTSQETPDEFPLPSELSNPDFRAIWNSWLSDRRARRKPVTARAAELQLKTCLDMGQAAAIEAIRKSIECGYQGIFAPRSGGRQVDTQSEFYKEVAAGEKGGF